MSSTNYDGLSIFLITCFSFIFVVGVFGNILVLQTFNFLKCKMTSGVKDTPLLAMERIICYLAVVDLISSICNPSLYIYYEVTKWKNWGLGKMGCLVLGGTNSLMDTISCGLILTIMIERCIGMCFPFKKRFTISEVRKAFAIVLVISILLEIPYIMHLGIMEIVDSKYTCRINDGKTNASLNNQFPQNMTHCFFKDEGQSQVLENGTFLYPKRYYELCDKIPFRINLPGDCVTGTTQRTLTATCAMDSCTQVYNTCVPNGELSYIYSRIAIVGVRDCIFLVIFGVCIYFMHMQVKKQENILHGQCTLNSKKTLYLLVTIAVVFYILVLPRDIFHFIHNVCILIGKELDPDSSFKANSFLKILQCSNSVSNVFIYAQLHTKVRQRIRELRSNISEGVLGSKGPNEPKVQLLTVTRQRSNRMA